MIDRRTVFEIHRLHHDGLSNARIARLLNLHPDTVKKYLIDPSPVKTPVIRGSKLDSLKDHIARMLEQDPGASAPVVRQKLIELGFDGGITIVRDHLRKVRPRIPSRQAFIRFESLAGYQFQVDWGHFGSIIYGNTARKLYCLAVIESHSRMMDLVFTHSQKQDALHRCLLHAFRFFKGTPKELVVDNMLTAVIERDGPLIRFNECFLELLRPFIVNPKACNVRRPNEKGKVEKGAIHYIRHNFMPLRTFEDILDVQRQAEQWRDQVANVRVHGTTGERPVDRFEPEALRSLPEQLPDCRDSAPARVHSDFAVRFDGNHYTVPPWSVGKQVMVKANHRDVAIYFRDKPIARHSRCWQRRKRIELHGHRLAARKQQNRKWFSEDVAILMALGETAQDYLDRLATTEVSIKKAVKTLLKLKDRYGAEAILEAMTKAVAHHAYGAHYIENILYQQHRPNKAHPPVELKDRHLNRIRLEQPSLEQYDALVIKRSKSR
jgi:transposase